MTRDPYDVCFELARTHYENFPVASWLLPPAMRRHVAAVYAFARMADDFADEGNRPPQQRHELLDAWERNLRDAAEGRVVRGETESAVFAALGRTMSECRLPIELFTDLLSAFRQDVDVARYATWTDLLDYCRRSANPVGRLVLRISGRDDAALDRSSDAICTALQLTNFWQDVERDWDKGRVYLPASVLAEHGASESMIAAKQMTPPLAASLAHVCQRTREMFDEGRYVCDRVKGRLGVELRATWLGGVRILEKLQRARFDVFRARPTLGAFDAPLLAARLALWSLSR